ncbi:MAG: hypothetical protein K2R98_28225 [Gemmataceae bacterium]|nr:hypothetical protein [Gemmataceae bacterium]
MSSVRLVAPVRALRLRGLMLLTATMGFTALGCGASTTKSKNFATMRRDPRPSLIFPGEDANTLTPTAGRVDDATSSSPRETNQAPVAPNVWHRDPQRPAFARVYVGDKNSLDLVSLHVTVTVEGPRSRTVVDHIFRNPHARQLEGTFEYPLPTGASASYYAMFIAETREAVPPRWNRGVAAPLPKDLARLTPAQLVKQVDSTDWGRLQEGRIVAKAKALETYEETVRGRVDPALLEYAGGNTFSGRVFPIPPRGYNRVILAYEELLPATDSGVQYRFGLPDCKLTELQFTLRANADECREAVFRPADAKKDEGGGQLAFSRTWKDQGPGGEALFAFHPPTPQVQAISGRHGDSGPTYVYARIRPDL